MEIMAEEQDTTPGLISSLDHPLHYLYLYHSIDLLSIYVSMNLSFYLFYLFRVKYLVPDLKTTDAQ